MRKKKQRLQRYALFAVVGLGVISSVAFISYQRFEREAARLPESIRTEISFSPFLIDIDAKHYKATNYKLSTMDDGVQLLSYIVTTNNISVTISEYVQPPQFTDIPEFKDRFLTNIIKQYGTVQTANGSIYLGKQTKRNDKQLGIMIERGLIVLMNPEKDLTDAQWRAIGEQLDIQKIQN